MRAALALRLLEAARRGGLAMLGVGVVVVFAVAMFGGDTPDGRYGLASDLAATLAYLGAVFFGALPLAADRERKRAYLPGASPVAPWSWALGNALGAAMIGALGGALLFAAAGAGAAIGGGIETHAVSRIGQTGTVYRPLRIEVRDRATHMRLVPRIHFTVADTVGTTDSATVEVDGKQYEFFPNRAIVVPIASRFVEIRSLSEDHAVGFDLAEIRALEEPRSFLANTVGAGFGPALGAAALAAFGCTASANLGAPVAALLTALVLALASLKGFMLETFEHEGAVRMAQQGGGHDEHDGHGHEPATELPGPARAAARAVVRGLLWVLPDLNALDRTDRVAIGEWTGTRGSGRALLVLLAALAVAATLGGAGVRARRLP